jgi:hypothetical protein
MAAKSVARELVEKSGVDVEKLIELLVRNASAGLTTFYYHTILRVNLIGLICFLNCVFSTPRGMICRKVADFLDKIIR